MAMTPEAKVKAQIKRFLMALEHCWFCVPNAGGYGVSGIPDILVCYKGLFLAIEVKKPGNVRGTTPLQETQLKGINAAMGYALVADCVELVEMAIYRMDRRLEMMRRLGAFEPSEVVSRLAA
jgi:hypothetical protein